jgi:hypothetical protein
MNVAMFTEARYRRMPGNQFLGGASQRTETDVSIPLIPVSGFDLGAGPLKIGPLSTRMTRARISPARSHSPNGIFAKTASPAL